MQLTIVRNAFMTWVKEIRSGRMVFVPDSGRFADRAESDAAMWGEAPRDPESLLLENVDSHVEPADGAIARRVPRFCCCGRSKTFPTRRLPRSLACRSAP